MAMNSKQLLQLLIVVIIFSATQTQTQSIPIPNPNCPNNCGSLTIPFPFGTTEECSLDSSFLISCNKTSSQYTPFLRKSNITVLNISLNGEMQISYPVGSDCYTVGGKRVNQTFHDLKLKYFHISSKRNKLTVVGCDTLGLVVGIDSDQGKNYTTGCVSLCNRLDDIVANGSCSGTGCCETSIPEGLSGFSFGSGSVFNHTRVLDFNPCGYTFLAEDGAYNFSSTDLVNFEKTTFPVVLDWEVGNQTCQEAQKNVSSYACVSQNSECFNSMDGPGYLCNCSHGFQGNPYLLNGCQDINECMVSNDCIAGAKCINVLGGYNCSCPKGYEGDGKTTCLRKSRRDIILMIALSVSVMVIALLMGSFYVYWALKKRKLIKLKEQFFQQNGGLLLQQQVARHRGSTETAKVFTEEELKDATNNFDEGRVLGQGGHGTVYRGILQDNRTVAIKKSKISDPSQIEQFINEVIILSQINHRNVVKLLGCCLETQVPLLVYEFIPNGTIYEHLHDQSNSVKLTWKTRLRIATEAAGALAYLHSATSTPIIHRDVKTTNILLDHNLIAKVSDFGASRIVPLDKNQLTTLVQGTLGYLDPEYFQTSHLTEKSDVYSFGVVLAELLTGKKALSFERPEEDRNLAVYFLSSMKEGMLLNIVDSHIIDEANVEQLREVSNIAKRCLRVRGEERPTMKEVARELEGLKVMEKQRWESVNLSSEENLLKAEPSAFNVEDSAGGNGIRYGFDSLNRISMSLGGGR
ncbi:putative wall-associated receptor kinase-like 16 [Gastrolobium bilobum]|uniref:putative wall-associated receptor kinase-like 16 n=1 Tax=Gastrolobium bilobum TaxID=150636 RepID=UPI002AB2255C|nr:putative wall-associated receptor kinase-like 16 [Gastrolobium bilobum]